MRPELVIFDCDGVLIDSEMIASREVARNLTALGWKMTTEEAMASFLGMSIADMEPMIESRLGHALPEHWRRDLAADLVRALGQEVRLIAGAEEILRRMRAMEIPYRIASNSSDEEMAVKFAHTGITALTSGLAHSATSLIGQGVRPKPAPDVFLLAAEAAGVAPGQCWVLEDSALGVQGAVAAGMLCYGFAPHGAGAHLTAAGAEKIVHGLEEFMNMLREVWR